MIKVPYPGLNDVLAALLGQIVAGICWAKKKVEFEGMNVEQVFYHLKNLVKYKKDPKGNELLQKIQTFCEGKYWNEKFTGDCDCFTIFTLTIFLAMGYKPSQLAIVLVGNTKNYPSHIYSQIDGVPFDLTNDLYGYERTYKYKQVLPLNEFFQ